MTDVARRPGGVKSFSCPHCGGTIDIRALGVTVTAVCSHCGTMIDVADPQLRIIQQAHEATRTDLLLPLGARGTLFGDEWEVIGYMERATESGGYRWNEFLLFNPWQGFRFLVEDKGHWNFVKMLRRSFGAAVNYDGRGFKLFNAGAAKVVYVLGEFYWRVEVGERVHIRDYIAPPRMLSVEEGEQDIVWSLSTYVEPKVIASAFGVTKPPTTPVGVAPNEPYTAVKNVGNFYLIAFVALVLLTITQLASNALSTRQVLLDREFPATAIAKDTPAVTDEFEIPGSIGNLEIKVVAPVVNSWLEIDVELVNQSTNTTDELVESVEYYTGSDSDGAWSEGGQESSDVLSAVPGGKYRLFLTADAEALHPNSGGFASDSQVSYRVIVTRNVPVWSNFFAAAALLLFWMPLHWLHRGMFEHRRWSESSVNQTDD